MTSKQYFFKLLLTGLVIFTSLLTFHRSVAQPIIPDTGFIRTARNNSIQAFIDEGGYTLPIFQGREWIAPLQKENGHPFFHSPEPIPGSIVFSGIEYTQIGLMYDLKIDGLVVLPPDLGLRLILPKHKVNSFIIGNDKFIRPTIIQTDQGLSDMLYYRLIYPGPSTVVAHEWKVMKLAPDKEVSVSYVDKVEYYMFDGKKFQLIDSDQDLIELSGTKNKELKKLLSSQETRFRKQPEQALITASAFYDRKK